jgi:hypothetical protein
MDSGRRIALMPVAAPPLVFPNPAEHARQVAAAVIRLISNQRTGRLTFANAATVTVLTVPGFRPATGHVSLTPLNAAAQLVTYRATYADGVITFNHGVPVGAADWSFLAVLS